MMLVFLLALGALSNVLIAGTIISAVLTVAFLVGWGFSASEGRDGSDRAQAAKSRFFLMLRVFLPVAFFCAAIPSKRELAEAYALSEASKLATAENVSKVADEVLQRVDALIEKVGK